MLRQFIGNEHQLENIKSKSKSTFLYLVVVKFMLASH